MPTVPLLASLLIGLQVLKLLGHGERSVNGSASQHADLHYYPCPHHRRQRCCSPNSKHRGQYGQNWSWDRILNLALQAYLRREGLHSSQIVEWRKLRDAGLLDGANPGKKVGRPTAVQAELARLRRQVQVQVMQRRLDITEAALTIMGNAHALLEQVSESAPAEPPSTKR